MKISIITTTYNSAKTLEDTLRSVASQTHNDIEHIIVDGGSTDETLALVEKYKSSIARVVSEKDDGIYDAMNKGIKLATGEVIGMLNSDDFLASDTIISEIAESFQDSSIDIAYGNIAYCDRNNTSKVVRFWKSGEYGSKKLLLGWAPPHPSFYTRKICYEKFGLYNTELDIAADYELMLRFLKKHSLKSNYLARTIVVMREGGHSAKHIPQRIRGLLQVYKSWIINKLGIPPFLFMRIIVKLPQFLN